MPAPLPSALRDAIVASLLAVTDDDGEPFFAKRDQDRESENYGKVLVPNELAEGSMKLVEGLSNGLNAAWVKWQTAQTVSPVGVPPMSNGGGPVVGLGVLP